MHSFDSWFLIIDYSEEVHGYIELKTNINRCTQDRLSDHVQSGSTTLQVYAGDV